MSRTRLSTFALLPLLSVLLLHGSQVEGYGFHDSQAHGTYVPGFGVKSIAQSGAWTSVVDGPLAALANPALISAEGGRTELVATAGFLTWKEEVHADTTISKRTDWLPTAYTLGGSFRINADMDGALAVGRVTDFTYAGQHDIPADPLEPGALDSLEKLSVDGAVYEASAGVSFDGPFGIRMGAATGLLFGGADYDYKIVASREPDSLARTESWSWTHTRPVGHLGMTYRGSLGSLSAAYISGSHRYSPRLGLSARVIAERIGHVLVGFEAEVVSPLARNWFIGRYHMQIPLRSTISLLTGMTFNESAEAHKPSLGFSFGCTVDVDDVNVGLCLDWRSKDRQGSGFPSEQADHVYDAGTIIALEISTRL